jgi:type IV pilus modification protein PilV
MRGARSERGFTMMEILVSLLLTIIGLAGVLMMQANAVKGNRQSEQFTYASNLAEQVMEDARSTKMSTLLAGATYPSQVYKGVTYNIALTATEVTIGSNLVRVRATVTYSEDRDTSTKDDRTAFFELIRTKTESL